MAGGILAWLIIYKSEPFSNLQYRTGVCLSAVLHRRLSKQDRPLWISRSQKNLHRVLAVALLLALAQAVALEAQALEQAVMAAVAVVTVRKSNLFV